MNKWLFMFIGFGSRVFGKTARMLNSLSLNFAPKDVQVHLDCSATRYDLVHDPDELFYAEQYWQIISPFLDAMNKEAQCLDLGCGQGRFSLRLAREFPYGKIIACDVSEAAIAAARKNISEAGMANVEFRVETIEQTLSSCKAASQDMVIMTEVTFYYPEWLSQMSRIIGILRPGALLVMSFRSQYFDSLLVARGRCWHNVDLLLEERRGHIFDSQKEFSWQTSDEIRFLLTREYKLDLHELAGVGVCSGVSGDPHDHIVRPSQLDAAGQVALKKMEMELGRRVPDAGRYMLAVAQKPKIDNKNKSLLK